MAVDLQNLTANLRRFYDFSGKIVLFVGAGGRQLLDPSIATRKVIAIDRNTGSVEQLRTHVAASGKQNSMGIIDSRFEEVHTFGDVVYSSSVCTKWMILKGPWRARGRSRPIS